MTLAVLGSRTVGLRHLKLAPAVETGPSGVPGRLRIVDPATQDDVLSLALEATATFDLDCLVLDARDDSELAGFTTIWSTSDAGVATVDADGVVTGVAAGTCTITASVTGAGGAPVLDLAALTVASPPAVATLEQSGTTLTGTVGGSGSFTVQPRDGSGNALAGREVIAASNDTGIATVSVSGYTVTVTFVAAGTCTVVPTCETVDGAGVAVTSADASSDHPHEPVGAVQRARHTFASTSEDGWSSFGAAYLKSDWGAAPRSPPSYIQFNKKSGVATYSSFDPGSFEKSLGVGYAKVYLDFFFQLSDAFQGHTSLTNKLGPFLCYAGGSQIFLNSRGADAAPLYARVRLPGWPPN